MSISTECGLQKLPSFKLISGVGDYDKEACCVMAAAVACWRLKNGEPIGRATDKLDCCCPVIRSFLIRLNDSRVWRDDDHRTEVLMPFVSRLAGTKNPDLVEQRVLILADWAVRTIAADALEKRFPEHCAKLRTLTPIVDRATAFDGKKAAAYAAAAAADAAYAAADAAADAAYAADAAAADAADAAAAAYAAAAAAADAAAAAYAADAARRDKIVADCVAVLERLISLSE